MPPRRSSASASATKRAAEQSANEAGDGSKRHKGGAAALSAAAAASSSAAAGIHRSAEAQQSEQQQQQRCCHPGCPGGAAQWCAECDGEMCATHDATWHISAARSSHRRVSLADRAAKQQQRMAAALAAEPERIRSAARSGLKEQDQAASAISAPLFSMSSSQILVEAQMEAKGCSAAKERSHQEYMSKLKQADEELAAWHRDLEQLRKLTGQLEGIRDAEVIAQEAELTALLNRLGTHAAAAAAATGFSAPAAAAASSTSAAAPSVAHLPAAASSSGSAVVSMRPANAIGLLGRDELSDDLCAHLQRFLGNAGWLSGARLLYRATRDGFKATDLWERCAGQDFTLTLVKVAGSGFLIGAFTPLKWPADSGRNWYELTDHSGLTFLFSLINGHGRPVKMSIRDDLLHDALNLSAGKGPCFGKKTDLSLMCGYWANHYDGCYASVKPRSFELDHQAKAAAGLPPIAFAYDKKLFVSQAGSSRDWAKFAAAEIEVYQL